MIAAFAALCALVNPARADAPAPREAWVPVVVDGRICGQSMVQDGTAYLPLRSIAKSLKLDGRYDTDTQMIFIKTPTGQTSPKPKMPPVE